MADTLVAATKIEYHTKFRMIDDPTGEQDKLRAIDEESVEKVVEPGGAIPTDFPREDLAELRKYGSIVTAGEWDEMQAEAKRRSAPVSTTVGTLEDAFGSKQHPLREIVRGDNGNGSDRRG
jgi:hypothetical protein